MEAPVAEAKASVPANRHGTGKFEVVADGGKFWVFNPEGARISAGLSELEATELAFKFQHSR